MGLFGQPTDQLVADVAAHRLELIGRKRCPLCATRLKARAVQQTCPSCSTVTFADIGAVNVYMRALNKRLPKTLLICFLWGLIPLIGMVPGVAYYRLSLIASLKSYVPRTIGCLTRWGLRLAGMVLMLMQPIPVIGAFTLPALCLLNYIVYRKVIENVAVGTLNRGVAPALAVAAAPVLMAPAVATTPALVTCAACGASQLRMNFCSACGARMG